VAPTTAPVRGTSTTDVQLDVNWAFLTAAGSDGGSTILSYGLEQDDGAGGAFSVVAGSSPDLAPYTLNSKLLTTAIVSGATYRLRYRAYNVHGWGAYSPIGTIIAATPPDAPAAPTLTLSTTNVVIAWTAPTNTGGSGIAITAYRVEMRLRDGSTYQIATCTETDAVVVSSTTCTLVMTDLTSSTGSYAYIQGDEITARITAANTIVSATSIDYGDAGVVSTLNTVLA
jgi:hypothetical protein